MTLRELAEEAGRNALSWPGRGRFALAGDAAFSDACSPGRVVALLDCVEAAKAVDDAADARTFTPALHALHVALNVWEAME